ncbi:rRNA-processing protein EBP2, putative [Hepatocystis sp. ex Piliocolobus tephrosceles]|nr:rRNA-processing protein EBP2, putative [Hepatocystis sp. ex Piliocolobus tephrosceles]
MSKEIIQKKETKKKLKNGLNKKKIKKKRSQSKEKLNRIEQNSDSGSENEKFVNIFMNKIKDIAVKNKELKNKKEINKKKQINELKLRGKKNSDDDENSDGGSDSYSDYDNNEQHKTKKKNKKKKKKKINKFNDQTAVSDSSSSHDNSDNDNSDNDNSDNDHSDNDHSDNDHSDNELKKKDEEENRILMKKKLKEIKLKIKNKDDSSGKEWLEKLDIVSSEKFYNKKMKLLGDCDIREKIIQDMVHDTVKKGLTKLQELNINFNRPYDFLGTMLKNDIHMEKLRQKILSEHEAIEKKEKNKIKKINKKVFKNSGSMKVLKQKEAVEKKKNLEKINELKKESNNFENLDINEFFLSHSKKDSNTSGRREKFKRGEKGNYKKGGIIKSRDGKKAKQSKSQSVEHSNKKGKNKNMSKAKKSIKKKGRNNNRKNFKRR